MIVQMLLGAAFFAAAAYLGSVLAATLAVRIKRFDDGPEPGTPPTLVILIICAIVGAVITAQVTSPAQIVFFAVLTVALAAIWYVDVRFGIVPDAFTLGPIAMIAAVAIVRGDWMIFVSMLVPAVPFAVAALLSKGRGMGWGDVKLAALGGAILGAQLAAIAFALACAAAVIVAFARHRTTQPIAFAPYLVTVIVLAIPVTAVV